MAAASDTSQAVALSKALRRAGWNPANSGSRRSWDAGLVIRSGVLGLGATLCLSHIREEVVNSWSVAMAVDLEQRGYSFERSETDSDEHGHTVWFRRVKKTEKS